MLIFYAKDPAIIEVSYFIMSESYSNLSWQEEYCVNKQLSIHPDVSKYIIKKYYNHKFR